MPNDHGPRNRTSPCPDLVNASGEQSPAATRPPTGDPVPWVAAAISINAASLGKRPRSFSALLHHSPSGRLSNRIWVVGGLALPTRTRYRCAPDAVPAVGKRSCPLKYSTWSINETSITVSGN